MESEEELPTVYLKSDQPLDLARIDPNAEMSMELIERSIARNGLVVNVPILRLRVKDVDGSWRDIDFNLLPNYNNAQAARKLIEEFNRAR